MASFRLTQRSKDRREGVDPRLIEISDLAITLTLVDFGHPRYSGFRTEAEQLELFQAGKSMCDGTDKRSHHQTGEALDFYAYVDGKASWEHEHLAMVACAFLQAASVLGYQLQWGGLWTGFRDMPHVQLVN